MVTLLCLFGAVALFAGHEFIVLDGRARGLKRGAARLLLLSGAAAFAVAFALRAHLATRVESALNAWSDEPAAFEVTGDPLLRQILERQRPVFRFPDGGTTDGIRTWQTHVAETLRTRAEVAVEPPSSVAIEVLESSEIDGVRRTLVEFTSWDGTRIPAYVHQPRDGVNLPAVLVVPGHGAGIRATAGIGQEDYQHALALQLAKKGYVTLTPELRGFGMLAPNGAPAHGVVAHAALESGSFYKAIVVRDLRLALTVLQQWDGVNPARLGVAGTSLGGELAVMLGGLDARLRVVVSHSYGGTLGPESIIDAGDEVRQAPHGCHTIPGVNEILYREDWFRLVAPRALQVIRGAQNIPEGADADTFKAAVMKAYGPLGAGDRFEFAIAPGRHEFFVDPAVRFLAKWL